MENTQYSQYHCNRPDKTQNHTHAHTATISLKQKLNLTQGHKSSTQIHTHNQPTGKT
jgi:hypothetical protein